MTIQSRRRFLKESAFLAAAATARRGSPAAARPGAAGSPLPQRPVSGSPSVAAIVTEYRPWSHADVIVGRFIQGYALDVTPHWPPVRVRALYTDQVPDSDLSRPLAKKYGIPIAGTIREAILDEGGRLAVDGVLLIGEHGDYPHNERGQHLYPRRRFFEETAAAFETAGQVVPVFNDKHLSARWEDGRWMYRQAKELGIPFMAGSSLPYTWRRPRLELPLETEIEEAVAVGYGGIESYGFHLLETLQCMVERRRGGESGAARVQCLEGEAVWEAMRAGRFSRALLEAALARHDPPLGGDFEKRCPNPAAFLIEYRDGLRAAALQMNGLAGHFLFAARLAGDPRPASTLFWLQEPVFGHFSYLANALVEMVRTGKPVAPVERTLLTTGILSYAMDSRFEGHRVLETPELDVAYRAADHALGACRHPEAAEDRTGGWIELFDGRSFDGWRERAPAGTSRWEVRDGVLIGAPGEGRLETFEEFADLELFAELRVAGGGSGAGGGITVRSGRGAADGSGAPAGYRVGWGPAGSGRPAGAIDALGAPAAAGREPGPRAGEWFTLRLRVRGFHLESWVNGRKVDEGTDSKRRFPRGGVALDSPPAGGGVELRELRLRRL